MYNKIYTVEESLRANANNYAQVVQYDVSKDKILHIDLSSDNPELQAVDFFDTSNLGTYIEAKIKKAGAKFGYGGYNELRPMYGRSSVFSGAFEGEEPRRFHLGVDIWAPAGTAVYAPLGGMVHSFAFNNQFGDYGATIILQHQLDTQNFHTLYGHLSLRDLDGLREGQYFSRGQEFAHLGPPAENGNWPPHLHFQIIKDMELKEGDYPGVCRFSERRFYLDNCPDPNLILRFS
jgi:peptidoglycan LD-endopeptidase LytH